MPLISVYIIAYNEEAKIREAVESVLWADEILVVDSNSSDATAEIAQSLGARVVQVPFKGFGDLRNTAIQHCTHHWIFSLDADERCTAEARDEILSLIDSEKPLDAYYVPRKNIFMGRWIKHSGFYPDYRQPQLFTKGALLFKDDPVHERYTITSSKAAGFLKNPITQIPFLNFSELLHKANRYSTLGALKLQKEGKKAGVLSAFGHAFWTFCHLYLIKRGFLDGWPGFIIAFGNFIGTFFKYAKLYEVSASGKE